MYVAPPRDVEVLLRDVLAGDSHLDETIDVAEELQGALGHWLDGLRKRQKVGRDLAERQERREYRRMRRKLGEHQGP